MPSRMRAFLLLAATLVVAPRLAWAQTLVVFVDGTRLEVQSYEVKESIVLLKTKEGKLMSVPRSYLNLVATEQENRANQASQTKQANQGSAETSRPPARTAMPAPKPPDPALGTETVEPEPPVRALEPEPTPATAPATPSGPNLAPSPPPVWSNEELQVSLVVPSAAWVIEAMPPSFDVAASLANSSTEAKATLALIRQKLRGAGDFKNVVRDVEKSISQAPGFRQIANGPLTLEPYTAHEFRFVKDAGFVPVFNRLVIVYSRDLAYVLSLACPETRAPENEADFEALVRGLVLKKSKKDLTF